MAGGTAVMKEAEGNKQVPKRWIQGGGQGLALSFLVAYAELLKEKE